MPQLDVTSTDPQTITSEPYTNVLLVHNPIAGQHDAEALTRTINTYFKQTNIDFEHRQTEAEQDAVTWAHKAASEASHDLIVALGGDGTVMEVLRGVIEAGGDIPILIVPLGTANVLARALDMPDKPEEVLGLIGKGRKCALDVGYIRNKDTYFCVATGAGFDARVVDDADRDKKDKWGILAYLLTMVKHLFTRINRRIDLELDGQQRTTRAHSVMILNASRINISGIHLGPGVDPHDGQLDILVMKQVSVWGMLRNIYRLLTGTFNRQPLLEQARSIKLSASPPLLVQADGEVLGETPLEITLLEAAVRFLVPPDYPRSSIFES